MTTVCVSMDYLLSWAGVGKALSALMTVVYVLIDFVGYAGLVSGMI